MPKVHGDCNETLRIKINSGGDAMGSNREVELLRGHLEGNGYAGDCLVMATKVYLPGTIQFEYARCSVHQGPTGWPDGKYTVKFAGRTAVIQQRNGQWLGAP